MSVRIGPIPAFPDVPDGFLAPSNALDPGVAPQSPVAARDVDSSRSAAVRAYFSRFAVDVPVPGGGRGETRKVALPFRISLESFERRAAALGQALGTAPSRRYLGLVVSGRATVEQLAAVVLDLALRHPEAFASSRNAEGVRDYLREMGVGIDCAGAVQLALLALHDLAPDDGAELGLKRRLDEDLSHLSTNEHFEKVRDVASLRPGDVIILHPPIDDVVGHTVIVTEVSGGPLTSSEAATLSRGFPGLAVAGLGVVRIGVASSFGWNGPEERTWVFDPRTKEWGDIGGYLFDGDAFGLGTPAVGRHSGPWDHAIEGMYRVR